MSPACKSLPFAVVEKFTRAKWYKDGKLAIPDRVPRGMNIPIACFSTMDHPEKGKMQRYGLDLVVCSIWLALAQAIAQKSQAQQEHIHALVRNWPFDFKYFATEELCFLGATQLLETNEFMREYFGLDSSSLIQVVMDARQFLTHSHKKLPDAQQISYYLANNIEWTDDQRKPSRATVDQLLSIGKMLERSPQARLILDLARAQFGRGTIFSESSKLLTIVQRCPIQNEFEFVMEGLYITILKTSGLQRPSKNDLKRKSGDIAFWRFVQHYFLYLWRQCPTSRDNKAQTRIDQVYNLLISPWAWIQKSPGTGGPEESDWISGTPKPVQLVFNHAQKVMEGQFNSTIRGFLDSPPKGGATPQAFLMCKVLQSFWTEFEQALVHPSGGDKAATQGADCQESLSLENYQTHQRQAEELCAQKLVVLTAPSSHPELVALLQGQHVFKNWPSNSQAIGIYDPKNARLARIYAKSKTASKSGSQNWWQRVPSFVLQDFQVWAKTFDAIMKPGVDVAWVFSGKSRANEQVIEAELQRLKWEFKEVRLVYDPQLMKSLYWKIERGVANSASSELLFLCWKGQFPKSMSSHRLYVDAGTPLYLDVMTQVPVGTKEELSTIDAQTYEELAAILGARPGPRSLLEQEAADNDENSSAEDDSPKKHRYPKRNQGRSLIRKPSTDEVPFFPLDNSPKLMQELAHESGPGLKWVFHGTPAGGCGLHGFLLTGLVVVAVVSCPEHEKALKKLVTERIRKDLVQTPGHHSNMSILKRTRDHQEEVQAAKRSVKKEASSGSIEDSSSDSKSEPEVKKAKKQTKKGKSKKREGGRKKHKESRGEKR